MISLNRRQLLTIIFGIIGLIGIILIVSVLWLRSTETRFKTYKDKKAGFSIKYPEDWTLSKYTEGVNVIFYSPLESDLDIFKENVNIVVQDISREPLNLLEYSKTAIRQVEVVFKQYVEKVEEGPVTFAGYPGYKYSYIGKGPDMELRFLHYWTVLDETYAYQFTFTALNQRTFEQYIDKAEQMARSFKIYKRK